MAEERPRYSWTEDRARNVQSNNQRCQDVPPSLAQLSSIVLGLECFKFNSQNRSTVSTGFNNKKMGLCYSKIEERRRNGKKEECMNNCKIGNFETDPVTLARRQKQIDYGKNTPEYAAYLEQVPKYVFIYLSRFICI